MLQLIIGHTTTTTVKIWVRGGLSDSSALITILEEGAAIAFLETALAMENYNTGTVSFSNLEPDHYYDCAVRFQTGNIVWGRFTTFPADVNSFNFLLASCHLAFGVEASSREFGRINWIAGQEQSRFMLGCGDQIYIDTIFPGFGIKSRDDYRIRYEHHWSSSEVAAVFGSLAQYMIIDDHEIYNNFVNDNLNVRQQNLFDWALSAYGIFQHAHNPETPAHILYYEFECAHADFFVMDLRTERTASQMISDQQFDALQRWLEKGETDRVKFIISSVPLFTQLITGQEKDKWSDRRYLSQRDLLIKLLVQSDHKKVIVLSGDIHLASHAMLSYDKGGRRHFIHELISSPVKQFQFPLLSKHPLPLLNVYDTVLVYTLKKHMGGPAGDFGPHVTLQNNFMSVEVAKDAVHYKVYAASKDALLFEDTIEWQEAAWS